MNSPHTSPLPVDVTTTTSPYSIVRIYLKSASSEVPNMSNVPRQAISPQVGVDMQTAAHPAGAGMLECVLRIALHARLEGKTIFLVEVSVAGVFELGISDMKDALRFVRKIAPSVLFPFARRDLASLTVAAGFQPVLLDHIDFDALLTQVITSQRLARQPTPMPMRLDVIQAKTPAPGDAPAVKAAPAATPGQKPAPESTQTEGHDTPPPSLSSSSEITVTQKLPEPLLAGAADTHMALVPGNGSATYAQPKRRARSVVLAMLGVATLGASLAWLIQREPGAGLIEASKPATVQPQDTPPTTAVTLAVATAVQPVKLSIETERAVVSSRARLADQPADWFTLDMGTAAAATPLGSVFPVPAPLQDRPVFVLADKDDSLRLLYGVFPSKEAAERVRDQLLLMEAVKTRPAVAVMPIGSFL